LIGVNGMWYFFLIQQGRKQEKKKHDGWTSRHLSFSSQNFRSLSIVTAFHKQHHTTHTHTSSSTHTHKTGQTLVRKYQTERYTKHNCTLSNFIWSEWFISFFLSITSARIAQAYSCNYHFTGKKLLIKLVVRRHPNTDHMVQENNFKC
jgi:hypothetical protein